MTPIAALRRQLLARGLTRRPVCPSCHQERAPEAFMRAGWCRPCDDRMRLETRMAVVEARLALLWPGEREDPGNEALAEEIRDLEAERFMLYYDLHPDEASHA